MKEETFSLPAGDGFTIYGRVNYAEEKARRAVVLCHGLSGHMYEHYYQDAKRFFTARGYDVIRFNFYGDEQDARRTTGCTVGLHAEDLKTVLAHFAPLYKRIYTAGHSYGGLVILMANPQEVAASSLWDAAFIPMEDNVWQQEWRYSQELDEYYVIWPPAPVILGKKIYEDRLTFTREKFRVLAASLTRPAQVLAAGAFEENLPYQKNLFDTLGCEKEYKSIPGATHCFYEGDAMSDVLENTYLWFERF